ncbi:MarC family protein [Infirmifilum sp. NZ]|uniref:MarC family protein n=1 Tax=Infirmifilum sp. NZ TaxID=2926850 RepID=UPI0027A8ABC2|nr:MarC family protein [Infirmifilum sp. NZ]UNQ73607.1 MarC family protein [Infirmifilum sp. NZ]
MADLAQVTVNVALLGFQLYAVLNPISVIPTFMSLMGDRGKDEKAVAVRRASLYAAALTAVFAVLGEQLYFLTFPLFPPVLDSPSLAPESLEWGCGKVFEQRLHASTATISHSLCERL